MYDLPTNQSTSTRRETYVLDPLAAHAEALFLIAQDRYPHVRRSRGFRPDVVTYDRAPFHPGEPGSILARLLNPLMPEA